MGLWTRAKRELRFLSGLRRTLGRVKGIDLSSNDLACDDFEAAVDKHAGATAVIFEGRSITYRDLDAMANRFAHWAKGRGMRRGDTVALFMNNRIEYLACWIGLSKVGVITALINHNLTGATLAHCLNVSGASNIVVDAELADAVEEVRGQLTRNAMLWVLGMAPGEETSDRRGLDTAIKGASGVRPDKSARSNLTPRDTALYIFTSGTTGMPKAAKIAHARVMLYMRAFAGATAATEKDRIYCVLPLYHATGGLCAVGAAFLNGGTLVLRRRFSATQFWTDVSEQGCTMFVYIGELCRYLVNCPEHELERSHKLRLAFGNGLRPDVWRTLQQRFNIPQVLEFYGSTEGNVSAFNFDGRAGSIGRVPRYLRRKFNLRLIRYDLEAEELMRNANGQYIECRPGEVGELIGRIADTPREAFTGYADKAASESRIIRDVFEKGDAWFLTGDLMRQDSDGYLYFVDRIGDTFRWKGENVSTTEVAERLAEAPGVKEVNVYGVAVGELEGKAGMASLVTGEGFDIKTFAEHVERELPVFARPLFVRIQRDLATTGTFKYRKVDLAHEGFDLERVKDPIWFRDPEKGYVKLTARLRTKILAGEAKL
jgi:fatty-acyl-CoA synthase